MNYRDYKPKLDKALLETLSQRHPIRSSVYVLSVFAGIIATFYLLYTVPSPATYVLGFLAIGILQHHLLIVQHETLHFFLFNSRRLNNAVGYFVSYLIGFTMKYRKHHFVHHRSLGLSADPDLNNYRKHPLTRADLLGGVLINLTGLAAIRQFLSQAKVRDVSAAPDKRQFDAEILGLAITQLTLLGINYALGHWIFYFIFWLLPLITLTKTLTNFRNLAEHIVRSEEGEQQLAETRLRTIHCGPIERLVFAPMNFNYHAEHHLFLNVPYQNLPRLHRHLAGTQDYARFVDIRNGYIATVLKYTTQ